MDFTTSAQSPYFFELLGVLWRRRWLVSLSVTCCATAAFVFSQLQTPLYESTATVLIDRETSNPLEKKADSQFETTPEYYETHFELLKSNLVLRKTAEQLRIGDWDEYRAPAPGLRERIRTFVQRAGLVKDTTAVREPSSTDERGQDLLARFQQQVDVKPVRGTRLARINARSQDPGRAAQIASTLAAVYINLTNEVKGKTKDESFRWFSSNLDSLRAKVEESEQTLYAYRAQHGLVDVHERQTMTAQRLAELSSELVKAEIRKAEAHSRYQQIASVLANRKGEKSIDWSKLDDYSDVLASPLIQTLRAQEIKTSGEVAELMNKYGPLHPKMAYAKSELQDLRARIQNEVEKIYSSLRHELDVAIAREQGIRAAVNRQKQDVIRLEQHQVRYGILDREAKSNQQIYDAFLKQMKENSLTSEFTASNVIVADPAVPAVRPIRPRKAANTVLGFLIGLAIGIGTAYWKEYWDRSVRGVSDLENHLPSVGLLGVVPRLPYSAPPDKLLLFDGRASRPAAESVRAIRTSLLLSGLIPRNGSLVITSPGPREGKTTLATNLAVAMAQLKDGRVLLIDADLRNPRRNGTLIEPEHQKGLVHFLAGVAEFEEVIHPNGHPNLWFMPPGMFPANPSELLHSHRMKALLKRCRDERFLAVIDTPPAILFSDPVIIGSQTDGVLMVVSAGETNREWCKEAAWRIKHAGGKLVGVVVQKTPVWESSHYSYYDASDVATHDPEAYGSLVQTTGPHSAPHA